MRFTGKSIDLRGVPVHSERHNRSMGRTTLDICGLRYRVCWTFSDPVFQAQTSALGLWDGAIGDAWWIED